MLSFASCCALYPRPAWASASVSQACRCVLNTRTPALSSYLFEDTISHSTCKCVHVVQSAVMSFCTLPGVNKCRCHEQNCFNAVDTAPEHICCGELCHCTVCNVRAQVILHRFVIDTSTCMTNTSLLVQHQIQSRNNTASDTVMSFCHSSWKQHQAFNSLYVDQNCAHTWLKGVRTAAVQCRCPPDVQCQLSWCASKSEPA